MTTPLVSQVTPRRTTPYISVDMFKAHARRGVSVDKLVPGGSSEEQDAALAGYIEQAGDWVDLQTHGSFAAGLDTAAHRVSVNRDGMIDIYPRYRPVIALMALAIGSDPGSLTAMESFHGICTDTQIQISGYPGLRLTSSEGPIQFGAATVPQADAWIRYSYMHGYPVTYLGADVAAGAVTMSLANVSGVVAGQTQLTVHALQQRFTFVATSVTPATGTPAVGSDAPGTVGCPTVPQAIVSLAGSGYPVMVSALPASLIEANVLVTRAIIKGTAAGSVAAAAASAPGTPGGQKGPKNSGDDYATAWAILERWQSAWRA